MYCRECDKEIDDEAPFCKHCGARAGTDCENADASVSIEKTGVSSSEPDVVLRAESVIEEPTITTRSFNKNRKMLVAIVGVVVLVAGLYLAINRLSGNQPSELIVGTWITTDMGSDLSKDLHNYPYSFHDDGTGYAHNILVMMDQPLQYSINRNSLTINAVKDSEYKTSFRGKNTMTLSFDYYNRGSTTYYRLDELIIGTWSLDEGSGSRITFERDGSCKLRYKGDEISANYYFVDNRLYLEGLGEDYIQIVKGDKNTIVTGLQETWRRVK